MNRSDLAVVLAFVALICGLIYDDNAAAAVRPGACAVICRCAGVEELVRMEMGR